MVENSLFKPPIELTNSKVGFMVSIQNFSGFQTYLIF